MIVFSLFFFVFHLFFNQGSQYTKKYVDNINTKNKMALDLSLMQYFITGGLSSMFIAAIIRKYEYGPALSAYIYGALPTIYFVFLWIAYSEKGQIGFDTFNVQTVYTCILFLSFIILVVMLSKHTLLSNMSVMKISTLYFIVASYIYFVFVFPLKYAYYKK